MKRFFQDALDNIWWIGGCLVVVLAIIALLLSNSKFDRLNAAAFEMKAAAAFEMKARLNSNPAEVENLIPNCPNGKVAIAIPADASSAEVKKAVDEMVMKGVDCRTTIIVGPKRVSDKPQKANSAPPLPLLP